MKKIVNMIPADLVAHLFYPLFALSDKPKTRIRFSASWWSGNEKYFCFFYKGIFLHVIPVRIIVP